MAVPARVNQANGNNYTGTTALTQATSAFAATAGNHIAVLTRGGAVASIADTAGNTYVKAGDNGANLQLWYAQNILGHASNVVTVTFTVPVAYRDVTAVQHSGLRTTGSLAAFAGGTVASGTTVSCTPSGVAYLAEQVCVSAADVSGSASFTFAPSGFTALFTNASTSIVGRVDLVRVFDDTVPIVATSANSANAKGIVAAVFLGVETSPTSRITQLPIEVLSRPFPDARASQLAIEVLNQGGVPPPARVSSTAASTWSVTSGTTYASPALYTYAGHTLIVCAGGYATGAQSVTGITDTAGNTYVKAAHCFEATDQYREEVWYATNVLAHSANIVTATWSSAVGYRAILVLQYSGLSPTVPFDVTAQGTAGAPTTVTTSTLTTTSGKEIHLLLARWGHTGAITWPGDFSPISTGEANIDVAEAYVATPFFGPYAITHATGLAKFLLAVTFKPDGSAGTPITTGGRLTQLVAEVLGLPAPPPARLTQLVAETLSSLGPTIPPANLTQLVAEVLTASPAADATLTQLLAEVLTRQPAASLTQFVVEVLSETPPPAHLTQLLTEVLIKSQPPAPGRVTQLPFEALIAFPPPPAAVTQAALEIVHSYRPTSFRLYARVSQAALEIIYPFGCYPPPSPPCISSDDFAIDVVEPGGSCPADLLP